MTALLEFVLGGDGEENSEAIKEKAELGMYNFEAILQKELDSHFGFGYRAINEKTGLIITSIVKDLSVDRWNKVCDFSDTICVGDRILKVNGIDECPKMVEALVESTECRLMLLKTGPRWHVDGPVAECMRKLDMVMEKGLKYSTRKVTFEETPKDDPRNIFVEFFLLLSGVLAPSVLLLALFSDMGYGIRVYGLLSMWTVNWYGNGLIGLATLFCLGLYVNDWSTWKIGWQKKISGSMVLYCYAAAFILKGRYYPYAPHIACLWQIPLFIGIFRATAMRQAPRHKFYAVSFRVLFVTAVLVLGAWLVWINIGGNEWNTATKTRLATDSKILYDKTIIDIDGRERSLNYEWDCDEHNPPNNDYEVRSYILTSDEVNTRDKACREVKTIWFLMWIGPFIAMMTNLVLSGFCFANSWDFSKDSSGLEKLLKGAIFLVFGILALMWVAASIAAASMRLTGTIMAFCGAAMMALMIWSYLEIGHRALTVAIKESTMVRAIIIFATNNWFRAGLVTVFGVFLPVGYVVSILNQKIRRMRDRTQSTSLVTEGTEKVMMSLQTWNWGNIFIKVNYLVIIYWFFFIGVAKFTYVFLSWLNRILLQWNFGAVIGTFFVIGFVMFLLPPVPGIPVYMTCGVVIAARAAALPIGFWGGVGVACALSFVLKITASCGQYAIGYFLGRSVKVQQSVGVDKILMRSVEKILQTPGLNLPKVAVLIGGPDWPTSVICGIIRINLLQIIIGTCPVILLSSPCVLAGAFLGGGPISPDSQDGQEADVYATLASSLLAASLAIQGLALMGAMYFIQDTIGKYSKELAVWRPEHAPVVELTRKERAQVRAWMEVLRWHQLSTGNRVLILTAVIMMLTSMFLFVFMDEACYRSFQVHNDIDAAYGRGGLDGKPLSLILWPGWVGNGLFLGGVILNSIFIQIMTRKARLLYQGKQSLATSESGKRDSGLGRIQSEESMTAM